MKKLSIDVEKCVSCGACAANCPDHFEIRDDGKAHLKEAEVIDGLEVKEVDENEAGISDAVNGCPVQAIELKD